MTRAPRFARIVAPEPIDAPFFTSVRSTFQSSAARKAQQEAFLEQQQARQKQTQRRQAEEEAKDQEAGRHLAQPEQLLASNVLREELQLAARRDVQGRGLQGLGDPLDHEEVLAVGKASATRMGELLARLIPRL